MVSINKMELRAIKVLYKNRFNTMEIADLLKHSATTIDIARQYLIKKKQLKRVI